MIRAAVGAARVILHNSRGHDSSRLHTPQRLEDRPFGRAGLGFRSNDGLREVAGPTVVMWIGQRGWPDHLTEAEHGRDRGIEFDLMPARAAVEHSAAEQWRTPFRRLERILALRRECDEVPLVGADGVAGR